ncbi:MAG: polysaccharide pyruvyl transferase family protein [Clostridiales bacterium]|nr:polysaccharide pyruvyl transferase family protein [Clostridiales bacterium]
MQKLTLKNLCDIDGLLEYLDALENLKNTLIIICIKDNAGKWLDDHIQKKLYKLGLYENLIDKLMVGYIALIKNSDVIYERLSKRDGTEEYADVIGNHDIHVISQPFLSGNLASVSIDQTEYAVNERGLNFVIFDLNRNEVIDSVSFDTHVEEYTCKRVKEPVKSHYDVCLVGCWFGSNYGSLLNGYAVYNILKSFGLEVLLLNKHNASNQDWEICGTHNERFIKQFYPKEDVSPVIPFQHLNILNDYCDTFLAGSDQIWAYNINKEFNMAFMLNFVNDSNKKISFASSFGHNDDGTPKDKQDMVKKLLQRFDAISVRESNGVKLCHDKYGVNAISVMEPVFCVDKQIFQYLAEKSNLSIDDPYILTYILDPSPEKREAILYYSKESGKKAYNILDGDPRFYENNKIALDLPDTMAGIGAEDFIYLFMNADFIITDSFHGTAFSLIFNKPFWQFQITKEDLYGLKKYSGKLICWKDFLAIRKI